MFNVRFAKQESLANAITWPMRNLWLLLRLRLSKNGMPVSTLPTAANGIPCGEVQISAVIPTQLLKACISQVTANTFLKLYLRQLRKLTYTRRVTT